MSWHAFERRSAAFAGALLAAGVRPGETVAIDLHNCPEYLEVFFAALKIRAVPANVNYRYFGDELRQLLGQLNTEVLVYDAALRERVGVARGRRLTVETGSPDAAPTGVAAYEDLLAAHVPAARIDRSGQDTLLSCTGGTTGLPRAVEYLLARTTENARATAQRMLGLDDAVDWEAPAAVRAAELHAQGLSPVAVPASPLMHSTGLVMASFPVLSAGGRVVTLTSRSFDADELFTTVEHDRPRTVSIVGDAFARPMLRALDARAAEGRPYDTSSLVTITSAGAAWSSEVKYRLLAHIPEVALVDNCGSSEGGFIGTSHLERGGLASTDRFVPAPGLRLVRADGSDVPAWSPERGMFLVPTVARGYLNDPERTAKVFRVINGAHYVLTGDWGEWNDDGTVTLIGRGTSTINTGGEKVFPEEVENLIRALPGVEDCVVLGRPDEQFGQRVAAVVQLETDEPPATATARITAAVRAGLASYKVPRTIVFSPVPRAPNGKILYPLARRLLDA
ncbi:AMP-binding protein [Cryptosporangium sp. NPDC051539]|uniref:AMP-binding protein n=1 Tax=Cryptosporangium sp. NPDC051539 TaxID=3363962 RepID=UPI00379ABECB